jgi:hypothetical protein
VLDELGLLQQLTGDYPAAAASQRQALDMFRHLGDRLGQARALARAMEGIGRSLLRQDPAEAATHLRHALEIYQDIGSPGARNVQDTLDDYDL